MRASFRAAPAMFLLYRLYSRRIALPTQFVQMSLGANGFLHGVDTLLVREHLRLPLWLEIEESSCVVDDIVVGQNGISHVR